MKKVKLIAAAFSVILVMSFVAVSCSKNNDELPPNEQPTPVPVPRRG